MEQNSQGVRKIQRQSNFELLRILGMLMIVLHHMIYHGGLYGNAEGGIKWIANFFYLGGGFGIQIFMLISSYFLMESRFSFKRLLRVIFEIWLYSVVIAIIFQLFKIGNTSFTWKNWVTVLMPITFNGAWFATTYVLIYLLSPFFNRMLHQLTKKQYQGLLLITLIFFNVIPTFSWIQPTRVFFNALTLFMTAYFWAGYIRRFSIGFLEKKRVALLVLVLCIGVLWGGQVWFAALGEKYAIFQPVTQLLVNYESIFFLFAAIAVFMLCKEISVGCNCVINWIASGAFGVYLIHDNALVRSVLWNKIVKTQEMLSFPWYKFLVYSILWAVGIYVCLLAVDLLRQYLIEKPLFQIKKFDWWFQKVDNRMNGKN